ncbi:MAG: hypothetical protein HY343_11065 [Lentisphaerae bacterium]|nr:hypothetical protein [Lentisphaerota bacterium]
MTTGWRCVLELDRRRAVKSGSAAALAEAIRRGADLRIYTEFIHNEHIDTTSDNPERIRETADFRVTYLLENRWVAGIINLRMPIDLPNGFGPRPSMSFFLYNQDGRQAIARPFLDGQSTGGSPGPSPVNPPPDMPKYHQFDSWDAETSAPSHNFVYDFEVFRYCVGDEWREVLHHSAEGDVVSGSPDALVEAFSRGCEVKVGIRGLCDDLEKQPIDHEVFVQVGSCYYYTERRQFMAASQPVVRVKPAIPLQYLSRGWDFGWLMPRSDGHVARWLCNPYSLKFEKSARRHAIRWFVRG